MGIPNLTQYTVIANVILVPHTRTLTTWLLFTMRSTIVQSTVLHSHVIHLSVCNVGGLWSQRLEILETNWTNN